MRATVRWALKTTGAGISRSAPSAIKIFMFDAKLVETRLFMHLDADNWVGYSYEWDEAQTEAKIVTSDRMAVMFNTGTRTVPWHYPSQEDCLTPSQTLPYGATLGPETAQMNRVVGGVNQIDKFASLGLFETPPAKLYKAALVTPYTGQLGSPPPTGRRRNSWLARICTPTAASVIGRVGRSRCSTCATTRCSKTRTSATR